MEKNSEKKEKSLREQVPHGTAYRPFQMIHFRMPENMRFQVMGHWHEEIEVLYFKKGTYRLERNMQEEIFPEGSICFIGSEELHYLEAMEAGSSHYVALFHPRILGFELMDEGQSQFIRPLLTGQRNFPRALTAKDRCFEKVRDLLQEMYSLWEAESNGWYLRCKVDLLQIVALLAEEGLLAGRQETATGEERVMQMKRLLSFLEEHYQEKLTLAEIAAEMNRNSQYLCRYFKETMGITMMEYLNRYRVEQAAALLTDTDKKVLTISLECGFENFSYFIRRFRQYKGMTPMAWRKLVKG